ncbi:hypothetical protein RYX36_034900 [Vicia faba]
MGLQEDFEEHAAKVKTLKESPSNETCLSFMDCTSKPLLDLLPPLVLDFSARRTEPNGMHGRQLKENPRMKQ